MKSKSRITKLCGINYFKNFHQREKKKKGLESLFVASVSPRSAQAEQRILSPSIAVKNASGGILPKLSCVARQQHF